MGGLVVLSAVEGLFRAFCVLSKIAILAKIENVGCLPLFENVKS